MGFRVKNLKTWFSNYNKFCRFQEIFLQQDITLKETEFGNILREEVVSALIQKKIIDKKCRLEELHLHVKDKNLLSMDPKSGITGVGKALYENNEKFEKR